MNKNTIPIAISASKENLLYLATLIQSIIGNSSNKNNYSIYVLHNDIDENNINRIKFLKEENITIDFISMSKYLKNYDSRIFYLKKHCPISTYFKFFLPEIFKDFDKIIHIDTFGIFLKDPAELYSININDKLAGAIYDVEVTKQLFEDLDDATYYKQKLKLNNPYNYFQNGILLLNIQKLINFDFTKKCINQLIQLKKPRYFDSCVINKVLEEQVYFIDMNWNVQNHLKIYYDKPECLLPLRISRSYMDSLKNPYYLNFTGEIKPWVDVNSYNAHKFFKYARMTPFYSELISNNVLQNNNFKKISNMKIFFKGFSR